MSYAPPLQPLTKEESDFAAENHNMVFRFLSKNRLDVSEYYDVVILRYLRACKNYCCENKLKQWAFSTIAFRAMYSAVYNYRRSLLKKQTISLDITCEGGSLLGELLPDPKADVLQTVIDRETIREYLSERKTKS